jgi:CDP-diacylglycerol--glycerol-3-phosphate 3-phosphatidyltransferase
LLASVLFVLASITDGLDGYLARKRAQITTMGMLLDPIADKIMVTAALIALVAYNPQVVKVWIVVVIIGREFLISGLRSIASSEGFTIQASDLGKLKTVTQIVAVVSAILAHQWYQWQFGVLIIPVQVDRRGRHLLHGAGLGDLGDRLLCGLLEADRPRLQRPPQRRLC